MSDKKEPGLSGDISKIESLYEYAKLRFPDITEEALSSIKKDILSAKSESDVSNVSYLTIDGYCEFINRFLLKIQKMAHSTQLHSEEGEFILKKYELEIKQLSKGLIGKIANYISKPKDLRKEHSFPSLHVSLLSFEEYIQLWLPDIQEDELKKIKEVNSKLYFVKLIQQSYKEYAEGFIINQKSHAVELENLKRVHQLKLKKLDH